MARACSSTTRKNASQRSSTPTPIRSSRSRRCAIGLKNAGASPTSIDAWFSAWDYAALAATMIRTLLEEAPASISMMRGDAAPLFNLRDLDRGRRASRQIARQLGFEQPVRADRHAAPRQSRLVLLRGLAFRPRDAAGHGRGARWARRHGRDLALCGRRRPHAPHLRQQQRVRLARHLLCGDFLHAGRLDLAVERGPLHGCDRLWQQ